MAHLFQEFHVLAAHPSLAELQQSVGCCRVMQDDLKDLRTVWISQHENELFYP